MEGQINQNLSPMRTFLLIKLLHMGYMELPKYMILQTYVLFSIISRYLFSRWWSQWLYNFFSDLWASVLDIKEKEKRRKNMSSTFHILITAYLKVNIGALLALGYELLQKRKWKWKQAQPRQRACRAAVVCEQWEHQWNCPHPPFQWRKV